jgi:hypothetical protein
MAMKRKDNFDGMFKSAFLKSESGGKWHTQAGICIIFFQVIVCTHGGEVLKEGRIPTERTVNRKG